MISGFYYAHIGWFLHDTKYDKLEASNPVMRDFGKETELAVATSAEAGELEKGAARDVVIWHRSPSAGVALRVASGQVVGALF